MRIAIIEDEKPTARDLERTLRELEPGIDVAACLHSAEEAEAFLSRDHSLDLIFSDIDLGDGLSLAVFEKIGNTIPVIFVTAYNQYALHAFRVYGIDYLLKPVGRDALAKTLDKFRKLRPPVEPGLYHQLLENLQKVWQPRDPAVIVYQKERIIPVKGSEIALFSIEHDQVFAYTFANKKLAVSENLDTLEATFDRSFFRVNRQFLVNRAAIKEASPFFHRKLLLHLTVPFPEKILVGKLKSAAFLKWLAAV